MAIKGRPGSLPVIFRTHRGGSKATIALFPTVPVDARWPQLCQSYTHVGQHNAADPYMVMRGTRPATRAESAELARELRTLGYRLVAYRRITARLHGERRGAL